MAKVRVQDATRELSASAGKVPVDMTRRRYVKKPAGAKPGFVIYTNQKTVLAEPWEG